MAKKEKDINRKTGIPLKSIPAMVEWLLKNCTQSEILFMAELAGSPTKFKLLNSIFTRLTDYNIYEVFYTKFKTAEDLFSYRAAKRGEVAGLKAFSMACQAAKLKINEQKENER